MSNLIEEFYDLDDEDFLDPFTPAKKLINWEDVSAQKRVLGNPELHPYPTLYPDPKEWVGPYLRDFVTVPKEDHVVCMQLDMFAEPQAESNVFENQLGTFVIHDTVDTFRPVLQEYIKSNNYVALDIETSGLNPYKDRIRCLQVCNDGKVAHILLCERIGNPCRELIQELLEYCPVVLQNGMFDLSFLLVFTGAFPKRMCFDTLIAAQEVDAGLFDGKDKAFGLGALAYRYLGIKIDKSKQKSFAKQSMEPMTMEAMKYAANDVLVTWRLAVILQNQIEKEELTETFRSLDLPSIAPCVDIKVRGVPVDLEYMKSMREKYLAPLQEIINRAVAAGITAEAVTSPAKLLKELQAKGYIGLEATGEGDLGTYFLGYSVRQVKPEEREIIRKKCPAVACVLEYREKFKVFVLIESYLTKFYNERTGCLHPNLNICGSTSEEGTDESGAIATGRYSSNFPNLQQCPSSQDFRDIFTAPAGYLMIKTDASQQEVRVMAEVSGDENLQKIYIEAGDKPVDIYKSVAASVLNKRDDAVTSAERKVFKSIVLAVGFAAGAGTIAASAGIPEKQASDAIKAYFVRFPKVKELINGAAKVAQQVGVVTNAFTKRRRHWNPEKMRGFEFKYRTQAGNHKIQSGAADCSKKAFLMAYKEMSKLGCRPLPPIHDELLFVTPIEVANQALSLLSDCMIKGSEYYMKKVPMLAEGAIGYSWRKEAGYCYGCECYADEEKPENIFKKRYFHQDVKVHYIGGKYEILCDRCYINKLMKLKKEVN